MLYPLQFTPRVKKLAWGVENWVVSGMRGDETKVRSGFLKSNSPSELTETYMGELIGDEPYLRFGDEFPLLVKVIDTDQQLSVQVHPDDALAARRHNAYGKTEMWYIIEARPDARIALGFKEGVTPEAYVRAVEDGTVEQLLNYIPVKAGDAFFVPAGTVHALGGGISLVEVQQPSDITYRIFDYGRGRELHTELAGDAIVFDAPPRIISQSAPPDEAALLVEDSHFTVNLLNVATALTRDLAHIDSFVLYTCTAGEVTVGGVELKSRDTVLIPADQNGVSITGSGTLLETYI